jgi:hypothetical protein
VGYSISGTLGMPVAVAVRPEKVSIAKARPGLSRNLFNGQVKEIAYFGSYNTYIVVTPQGKRMKITEPNGSHLNCSTSPGKTRCFSGGTTPTRCCCATERGCHHELTCTFKMPGKRFVIGVPFTWLVTCFFCCRS